MDIQRSLRIWHFCYMKGFVKMIIIWLFISSEKTNLHVLTVLHTHSSEIHSNKLGPPLSSEEMRRPCVWTDRLDSIHAEDSGQLSVPAGASAITEPHDWPAIDASPGIRCARGSCGYGLGQAVGDTDWQVTLEKQNNLNCKRILGSQKGGKFRDQDQIGKIQ